MAQSGQRLRVSIIVNNHNYAPYLPFAIDSALGQIYDDVEVVVVDDGSTDESREIIGRYGDRVRPVLQERQGQTSAFNSGFAASSGDAVVFLDADDVLYPDTASRVAAALADEPSAARVVFRLRVVDRGGRSTGAYLPSKGKALPHGDVRRESLSFPDDLAWPPTSGNAFASWVLDRLLPFQLEDEKTGADRDLHALSPLLGPVLALSGVGGEYRVHTRNADAREGFDLARSRRILQSAQHSHGALNALARELGYGSTNPRSVSLAAHRLASVRIGGPGHPFPLDTRWCALKDGVRAALARWDVGPVRRSEYIGWFVVTAVVPSRAVTVLAARASQPLGAKRHRMA